MSKKKPVTTGFIHRMIGLMGAMSLLVGCGPEKTPLKPGVLLTNTASIALKDKAVRIDRDLLSVEKNRGKVPVLVVKGDTISSQLNDLDGDGLWDELFLVTDFQPQETKEATLVWVDKLPGFTVRTNLRFGKRDSAEAQVTPRTEDTFGPEELPKSLGYQPYQTDGPLWENDKVGFRHYFDGRNAKDLFGKKISGMSPDWVGLDSAKAVVDNYHVMEDWGRDVLSVGNSVGLGGYGLKTVDSLLRLGVTVDDAVNNVDRTSLRVGPEGPVNSMLHYTFTDWKPTEDRSYTVSETTSIWPGMYGYQNTVAIERLKGDEELVVGLVNINTEKPLQEVKANERFTVLYTHDQQTYEREWWLGMALIVPNVGYLGHTEAAKTGRFSTSYLARFSIENNKPITYYAVAGWELSDPKFAEENYFKEYVIGLADQLAAEIDVNVKNVQP